MAFDRKDINEKQAVIDAEKKRGFEHWMRDPMCRLLISKLSVQEDPDTIEVLLQGTYSMAFDDGAAFMAVEMFRAVSKEMDK